jgi:hypothetical protein
MLLSGRIDVSETPFDVRFVIGPRRNPFLWIFVTIWSAGWTLGGIAAIVHLIIDPHDRLFISVWLCGCAAAFFIGWSTWLWNGFGFERLLFNRDSFAHQRDLFGHRLTHRTFSSSEVFAFRANGPFGSSTLSREQLLFTSGTIDVDCAYDSFSFGYQLEENEANSVVELLNSFVARRTQGNSPLHAKRA